MKDKFLAKFDEILNTYVTQDRNYRAITNDPIKSKRIEQDSLVALNKATDFFNKLIYSLPQDQMERLHSLFEQKFIEIIGEASYKNNILLHIVPPKFPTPESRKYHLFYSTPATLLKNGTVRTIIEDAVQHVDDKMLESMIEQIDAYESDITTNVKVEFFRARVEELKIRNAENIKDPARLKELNDELESVAQTVITSTPLYSSSQGDVYDAIYRRLAEDKIDELNDKAFAEDEYKPYKKYFADDSSGRYGGTRSIAEEHIGDTNMANAFTDDKVKMVIPEKTKNSIIKILSYMRERNMLRDDAPVREADYKIYGFAAIHESHQRLAAAIETEDVEQIRRAKEQYKTDVESMRGLYALIKEEFNPDINMFVGNINSYREQFVPNEFKNDLVINVLVNGFFNLNASLAQNNVSIEQLCQNPNKVFMNVIKGFAETAMADTVLKDKSIAESIKIMTMGKTTGKYSGYGLGRNMEFLQAITYGTDAFEKNSLSTMFISSYAMYVGNIIQLGDALTTKDYLNTKEVETLANVLLVNPEDRNYNKLRAVDGLNIYGSERISAFDTMKYLTTHDIDADKLVGRIRSTVEELYNEQYFQRNSNLTKNTAIADTIRAAQFAAYQFLTVHPTPVEGSDKAHWNALKDIMMKPERVFKNQIDANIREALDKRVPKHTTVEADGKAKFDAARIEARAAEEAYAKSIADIQKELNELSSALLDAGGASTGDNHIRQRQLEEQLKELPKLEQSRLDKAYTDGKLPKDYYEQRKRDIQSGAHQNKVPFGSSEYPGFGSFRGRYKAELKSGELSKEDVRNLYDRMMENARYEEKMFYLVASGVYPNPTLEAEEVAIVPEREPIVVDIVIEKNVGTLSKRIEDPNLELSNAKEHDQIKV